MSKAKEKYYEFKEIADKNFGGLDTDIANYVAELEQQINNLKCCGNCKYKIMSDCGFGKFNYCKKWKFDGLTQKERGEVLGDE